MRRRSRFSRLLATLVGLSATVGLYVSPAPAFGMQAANGLEVSPVADVASRLGTAGRLDRYSPAFSGISVAKDRAEVTLYATETDRGQEIVADANESIAETTRRQVTVTVRKGRYAKVSQLTPARDQLIRVSEEWQRQGVDIYGIAIRPDGSGIRVDVSDPSRAEQLKGSLGEALDGGVATADVTFAQGAATTALSGRGNDTTTPYAAGARIRAEHPASDPGACTSGFGMRNQSGGTSMVSASHCFMIGDRMRSGGLTLTMGSVNQRATIWDASAAPTNTYEVVYYEGSNWSRYGSWGYSYNGQSVCQSGYTSDRICALEVIDDDYAYQLPELRPNWTRGVRVSRGPGIVIGRGGDSGGPVYVTRSDGLKQSRGIVSGGQYCDWVINRFGDVTQGCTNMMFTETGRILNQFNGSLLVQ